MAKTDELAVTVLRDNLARPGLLGGHGLALLVRTTGSCLLLDTGDSAETWENADRLGVDLGEVSCLVLSHGHYDHTGGIEELLRRTGGMPIVAHPAVFEPRWAIDAVRRYIGQPHSRAELEEMGARLQLSREPVEVAPGVLTTGEVPPTAQPTPVQGRLQVERDGRSRPDDFIDDLSLVVSLPGGSVVLTGCAHAGLINIVERCGTLAATEAWRSGAENRRDRCGAGTASPVRAIIGGTHLMHSSEAEVAAIAGELRTRGVAHIAPLHCTGRTGREFLSRHFAGQVLLAQTGDTILAGADGSLTIAAGSGTVSDNGEHGS